MYKLLLVLMVIVGFAASKVEADGTAWAPSSTGASARLVLASDAMTTKEGALAAIEIKLPADWKTYWRSPGEAGLPAMISVNDTPVDILFPLPKPIVFYGIKTFGYGDLVSLPFRIPVETLNTPQSVKLDYMVCKDICVPIVETFTLDTSLKGAQGGITDISLEGWLKKVPTRSPAAKGLKLENAKIVGRPGHQRLIVDGYLPQAEEPILFVAEADGYQMGTLEKRRLASGNGYRFIAAMVTKDDQADLHKKDIRVTLALSETRAIEHFVLMADTNEVGR